jgi:hypothetical protein
VPVPLAEIEDQVLLYTSDDLGTQVVHLAIYEGTEFKLSECQCFVLVQLGRAELVP